MIARIQKHMSNKEKGFTLIELLVVVIIIGILAAIAIPAFLKQREKAWEKQVESDLKNAATSAEAFATSNNGVFTIAAGGTAEVSLAALKANGYNQTSGVTDPVVTAVDSGKSYTISAGHKSLTGNTWTYDSRTGIITKAAAPANP